MRTIWDISPRLHPATPVFPGDTPFQVLWNERINDGGCANVSTIHMSPHAGAHVDAPMHLDSKACDIASLRLETFIGRARVVDLSEREGDASPITIDEMPDGPLPARLLLKTRKSLPEGWCTDYRPLAPAMIRELHERGVVLIGIDAPSVDPAESRDLPAHRTALVHDMLILENLDFRDVEGGEYELIALPLRLEGVEASPVRAVLRSWIR